MLKGYRLYLPVFVVVTVVVSVVVMGWFQLITNSIVPTDAQARATTVPPALRKPERAALVESDSSAITRMPSSPVSELAVSSKESDATEAQAAPSAEQRSKSERQRIIVLAQQMIQKASSLFQSQSYRSVPEDQIENIPYQDELSELQAEFLSRLNSEPTLAEELLKLYAATPDATVKKGLAGLLSFSEQPSVTDAVVARAFSSDTQDHGQWFSLLAAVGIHETKSLEHVLENLPAVSDSAHLVDAISAIRPDAVHNSDRHREITNEIFSYVSYDNAAIRSSVFKATSYLIDEDNAHILEQGLTDSSDIVREAAALSVQMNPVPSDSIRNLLLQTMINPEESRQIRVAAYVALEQYPLDQSEREFHRTFFDSL